MFIVHQLNGVIDGAGNPGLYMLCRFFPACLQVGCDVYAKVDGTLLVKALKIEFRFLS
jgi:hypothetical protein